MKVAILMGSPNDRDKMAAAVKTLEEFGIEPDERVLSAHRTPAAVVEMARGARDNGYVAFICGAGMAAHLAGAVLEPAVPCGAIGARGQGDPFRQGVLCRNTPSLAEELPA